MTPPPVRLGPPVNKDLTRLSSYSLEFADALEATIRQLDQLDQGQILGIETHLKRIHGQINRAIKILQTTPTNNTTQSPCGSH